ncbi:hypothetical protein E5288_WYG010989 [Bos mutus]|uniref:Uncharacterized protein n=1 Tax=Bos mutus TaxID=72004 RepID=A0A6B0QWL7_9CETA|nr:hypothetical protein [Bos mutus]
MRDTSTSLGDKADFGFREEKQKNTEAMKKLMPHKGNTKTQQELQVEERCALEQDLGAQPVQTPRQLPEDPLADSATNSANQNKQHRFPDQPLEMTRAAARLPDPDPDRRKAAFENLQNQLS